MKDRIALKRLIEERLKDSRAALDPSQAVPAGFSANDIESIRAYFPPTPIPAAVLVPIVDRESGLTVLLTQRASTLKNHAGQISFPGGRIEPSDLNPAEAALRETEEEIGVSREHIRFVGYLEPQLVLSGYWVTPVVAFVQPGFELRLDRREVESAFEVPLAHILDPVNHRSRTRELGAVTVQVFDIPYLDYNIWGATAGMLMSLYRLLQTE
ncbi:NUDIX hydrolase [Steroidobacter sp.]|uniref:NUDIX hydrolase n=1 Tax=Steroidobacter sp. TaxID=1978227 RepID=UPI001A4BE1A0|nr:CoA pyrophosphatase [Steroidobacter sp.]MBL8271099.1 CoA pyrophosphatase [Steroidobacter sp.]